MIAAVYSMADVFVIPSFQDNLPNTVLEAMACGRRVVGFRIGGIPDMVRDGENGLLAPPVTSRGFSGDPHAASDDERRRLHGEGGACDRRTGVLAQAAGRAVHRSVSLDPGAALIGHGSGCRTVDVVYHSVVLEQYPVVRSGRLDAAVCPRARETDNVSRAATATPGSARCVRTPARPPDQEP